ncbi:hypothetical protein [Pseudorhodoferax soli]|uniref:Novel STAND NTPase 3 domain-containing protein n=1 Tax=Pseudorhodoferax soli TaxID=545864 RepID=A0A368XGM3_9BURK|nr:hypothetical protein [Pseudorhodoferax soli]RCW65164.1 hypothetical protein DES41_11388 [Pseudorhodoferax soli]
MIEPADSERAQEDRTGARPALAGYAYQVDVSILAALRILFVSKSASRITLEPAGTEDIEVELAADDPGHVQAMTPLGAGHRLVMQVKLRNGEPWSIDAFIQLLKHGKRRTPAKDHLRDPHVRYLLVTNADVSGVARDLLVEDFEEHPGRRAFPHSLRTILPEAPDGRVAIYSGLTRRLLAFELEDVLTTILRVPKNRQDQCLAALRTEAKSRMAGISPGAWAFNDLLATIRAHGGFLASVAELDAFVPPSNYPDMVRQLDRKHAVVIAGSSGTGKTLAAQALCDRARRKNGALDIVVVDPNSDPSSIRQLVQTGPKLFYLEDPWGQNSLRVGSATWTDQLPHMLRGANAGNRFVVTSRSDMLSSAQAGQEFDPWIVQLEADRYHDGRLAEIYDRRMDLLPPELQSVALGFKNHALSKLEKPLEIDRFFAGLISDRNAGENDGQWLHRLIDMAHRDAVEAVVCRFLAHADESSQSAVIWGLLAARGSFERTQLFALVRRLRSIEPSLAKGLDRLVDTLIAARHLRQPATTVAFAHPSVRAAFETHLKGKWLDKEPAFTALLSALTTLPDPILEWGMETAARAIGEGRRLVSKLSGDDMTPEVPAHAQRLVDQWLDAALVDPGADFSKLLELASDVGSAASNPSELARWLLTSVRRGVAYFMDEWTAPTFSDEWYEQISNDPRSFAIADRFVREQLASERGSYDSDFPAALDRIAKGLDDAYLDAAHRLVGMGHGSNFEPVLVGATRDLTAFKCVFDEALDDLAGDEASRARRWETRRSIDDGECDYAVEEYYNSGDDDEGFASGTIIEHYVKALRTAGQWRTLAQHHRRTEPAFSFHWARAIGSAEGTSAPCLEELTAMVAATRTSGNECEAWRALRNHWHQDFRESLKQAIGVGIPDQFDSHAAMDCAMAVDRTLLCEVFNACPTAASRVALLGELVGTRKRHMLSHMAGLPCLVQALRAPYLEIGKALLRNGSRPARLSPEAVVVLQEAAETLPPRALSVVVPLLLKNSGVRSEHLRRWLKETTDADVAEEAARAAVAIRDEEAMELALRHCRANARAVALDFLANRADAPLSAELLALCSDPGHRVRLVLVRALAKKPHPLHLAALLHRMSDTWSDADPYHNDPDSFPIAREAALALAAYAPLNDEVGDFLLNLARTTLDRRLRQDCLQMAARHGSPTARQKTLTIVCSPDREPPGMRLDALDALVAANSIEPELLEPFTPDWILSRGAALATSATVLVCDRAPLHTAVAFCERMVHSSADRSLGVLGACRLHHRDAEAAQAILNLLQEQHPARQLLAARVHRLPLSVLDDLGDIKRQPWVQRWLSDRIADDSPN